MHSVRANHTSTKCVHARERGQGSEGAFSIRNDTAGGANACLKLGVKLKVVEPLVTADAVAHVGKGEPGYTQGQAHNHHAKIHSGGAGGKPPSKRS